MTTPKKIDGYCAWHPEQGYNSETLTKLYATSLDVACRFGGYYEDTDFGSGAIDAEDFAKDGWQIKPVLLADASTEVVVPRELVGRMISVLELGDGMANGLRSELSALLGEGE